MSDQIASVRYHRSPLQSAYPLKVSFAWGKFVRYIELGDDGFATRQVDKFENGYLTRYDRTHWDDQFGSLADFRFGTIWRKHWGEPDAIDRAEFESVWSQASTSPPFSSRAPSSFTQPPWILLFESGRWSGQS